MNKHCLATGAVIVVALGGGVDLSLTQQTQSLLGSANTVGHRLDALRTAVENNSLALSGDREALTQLAQSSPKFADK